MTLFSSQRGRHVPNVPIYVSFLDGSIAHLLDALNIYEEQVELKPDQRSALRVEACVRAAYQAIDKLLKLVVSRHDPALLIKGLKPALLRELLQVPAAQRGPSLFTSGVRLESYDAVDLVEVLERVVTPHRPTRLNTSSFRELDDVLRSLTRLRNQAEHSELYGHSDQMLGTVQRQLALVPELARAFAPDLLSSAVEMWDNQAESRLNAIRDQVDTAWQVVLDYLKSGSAVECPCNAMVATIAPETDLILHLYGDGAGGLTSNRVYSEVHVAWSDASGMFRRILQAEPPPELGGLLSEYLAGLVERSVTPPSRRPGIFTTLGGAGEPPPPPEVPRRVPIEAGSLTFTNVPGNLSLYMPSTRRSYVSVRVELRSWTIGFRANVPEGSVEGELVSAKEASQAEPARTLKVSGQLGLTSEGVASSDSEDLGFPAGATLRWFKGTLVLRTASN